MKETACKYIEKEYFYKYNYSLNYDSINEIIFFNYAEELIGFYELLLSVWWKFGVGIHFLIK